KLASWINLLIAAGFVIEHLDEWGPTAEQIAAQPGLDEEKERPMIFLLRARKPA
ncbi:TPA: SAM-dependent methyltransferase, partial [Raoultella planticola]